MPSTAKPWDPIGATASLRRAAGTFTDPEEMYAGQSLADYLESTIFPGEWRSSVVRHVMGEMALAFMAGWEQGNRDHQRPKQLARALIETGLGL